MSFAASDDQHQTCTMLSSRCLSGSVLSDIHVTCACHADRSKLKLVLSLESSFVASVFVS